MNKPLQTLVKTGGAKGGGVMNLNRQSFNRATQFLLTSARPLEQALFRFHFEDGPAADVIREQAADGSWVPTWSWGDEFPDVWPVASREWQGVLTLDAFKTLRAFGRLEVV